MQINVQIVVQTEVDEQANTTEIARFERTDSMRVLSAYILMRQRRC